MSPLKPSTNRAAWMRRWSTRHRKTVIDARDGDCATRGIQSIASMLVSQSYVPLGVNWKGAASPTGCA
jgi:hypothetical protein